MSFKNRIVFISGVSRGIGKALALDFLNKKSIVIGISRKDLLKDIAFNHKNFFHFKGNVNNVIFLKKIIKKITSKFGKIDVLILNAAIIGEMKKIKDSDYKIWKSVINTNLNANFLLVNLFNDLINKSKSGRIVCVTSSAAWKIRNLWGSYSVSKAGLEVLVKIFIKENNNKNLKINFIDPGRVRTNMRKIAAPNENPTTNPLPENILEKFLYLSSKKCKFSGKILKAQDK